MRKFNGKKAGIICGVALASFTSYALLDTFVIPHPMQTVSGQNLDSNGLSINEEESTEAENAYAANQDQDGLSSNNSGQSGFNQDDSGQNGFKKDGYHQDGENNDNYDENSSDQSFGGNGGFDNGQGFGGPGNGGPGGHGQGGPGRGGQSRPGGGKRNSGNNSSNNSSGNSSKNNSGNSSNSASTGNSGTKSGTTNSGSTGSNSTGSGTKSTTKSTTNSTTNSTGSTTSSNSGTVIGTYSDSKSKITVTQYRAYDSNIYVADVEVTDGTSILSAFANNTYGRNITDTTSDMAEENNAVLAINGDYYGARQSGYVIRNGVVYRNQGSNGEDMVISKDGTLSFISESDTTTDSLIQKQAWQVLSFGPVLVENGQIAVTENDEVGMAMASNPRTAIGTVAKNHYLFVVSDGRTSESAGLSLYELANFMKSLGATNVYNLDGGGSSTMIFQGEVVNNPTTNGNKISERAVSDILYIGKNS
ncbi:MAG: phosphodiester glycosidase family protein [Oribacterium sinus]|uniref:Phosphodiester glycosidase family protein n=1 Tax=Oribacterium sinus TaxID=237576 RepID=A0A930DXD6_9FIRM|nr:phosphodiester glycosidase family protein [Oribacterium sinus]